MEHSVEVLAEKFQGKICVTVNESVWERAVDELKWAIIVKPLTRRSYTPQTFKTVMMRAWMMTTGAEFSEIEDGCFLVKFDTNQKMTKVLEDGPWSFMRAAVLLRRWKEGFNQNEELGKLMVCMQIHRLPIELITEEIAGGFAELAGRVCKVLGQETVVVKRRFMRYKIEIDTEKPLSPGVFLRDRNGKKRWLAFKYERLPDFCYRCGRLTHEPGQCSESETSGDYGVWLRAESPVMAAPGLIEEEKGSSYEEAILRAVDSSAIEVGARQITQGHGQPEDVRKDEHALAEVERLRKGKSVTEVAAKKQQHTLCSGKGFGDQVHMDQEPVLGSRFIGPHMETTQGTGLVIYRSLLKNKEVAARSWELSTNLRN